MEHTFTRAQLFAGVYKRFLIYDQDVNVGEWWATSEEDAIYWYGYTHGYTCNDTLSATLHV